MAQSVDELILAHLAGKSEATEKLVSVYRADAKAAALQTCGDRDLAEDATQEALIRALAHAGDLRDPGKFPEWLRSIARRERHRRRRLHAECLQDPEPGGLLADSLSWLLPQDLPGSRDAVQSSDTFQRVRAALNRLPSRLRHVLELRYLYECSYQEIAQQLGLTLSTAKGRLQMARDLFREWYEELDTCDRCEEQLEAFVAGALCYERAAKLHEHVFRCSKCLDRTRQLCAIRADSLAAGASHWHGAIISIARGIPSEAPRILQRLVENAERNGARANGWMMAGAFANAMGEGRQYLERAANAEPDSLAGLTARWNLAAFYTEDRAEQRQLGLILADAYKDRRNESALLETIRMAEGSAWAGDLELTLRLLNQAERHLIGLNGREMQGSLPAWGSREYLSALFARVESRLRDRRGPMTYELYALSGGLLGTYSPEWGALEFRAIAQLPLCSRVGVIRPSRCVDDGDRSRAEAALDSVLAAESVWPSSDPLFTALVSFSLLKLERRRQAVAQARRFFRVLARYGTKARQHRKWVQWIAGEMCELEKEAFQLLKVIDCE
jgi:RNA polymerase sigma-70 factor (ECF subfamily)